MDNIPNAELVRAQHGVEISGLTLAKDGIRRNGIGIGGALTLLYVLGTIVCLDLYGLPSEFRIEFWQPAQGAVSQARPVNKQLSLGAQRRIGDDAVAVTLEFTPKEEDRANQIRVEIEFSDGPWRFEEAVVPDRSSLEISVSQRDIERETPDGQKERGRVLSLMISAGREIIPAGTIAELRFALDQATISQPIPLTIHGWEMTLREEQPSRHPPMLEPPSSDTGMNPSTNCFFFSH